ncbi:DUF3857 domain-containing protein [Flavobacteriaceae bacterium]|nr:DUF3857 domain-containing protein [Flavobacteriaceae bacterium]MDB2685041.1 DUF3857 domain-containing protein [Flavobacteriaceae bacterium]MDB4256549.1 DUF3857 domain-containing protein [Flavobacteriaceae bacterium]
MTPVKNFILILFITCNSIAQTVPFYESYNWEITPSYQIEESDNDMVAIKDKVVTEFIFEDQNLIEYYLEHKVLWLNSDDRIEEYTKVYLPITNDASQVVINVRMIKKTGEIIVLDKSKILRSEDDETGRDFNYFSIDDVEKGSIIEYYYVIKRRPKFQGAMVDIESDYDKQTIEFDLYAPSNLRFSFKSFNLETTVKKIESFKEKTHWKFLAKDIKAVNKEEKAPYHAAIGFIMYKLHKNTANNDIITSYNNVAQNLFDFYYSTYSELEKKLINKFAKNFKFDDGLKDENKARIIDLFIKENIYISENDSENLTNVLKTKTANETGVIKLYIALFEKFDVTHEMVLTSNRLQLKFDKYFEATNFLQEFLFYFPASKKYLSPSKFGTRFGFPPPYFMNNFGLFVTGYDINGKRKAFSEVKFIEGIPASLSSDEMLIEVNFNTKDLTKNTIALERKLNGYYAMNLHPFMNLIQPNRINEVIDQYFVQNSDKNAKVLKREFINEDPSLFGVKPFVVKFDISSEYFVEKKGDKYLFKLGDLIGPQMEMQQEKKRILPLEAEFNRSYYRTIKIHIPEGYQISNLEDIIIKNSYTTKDKELFIFDSYYILEGNVLTVTADEHYRETFVAPEIFEAYRTVINSAADFNKVTLVLEPK